MALARRWLVGDTPDLLCHSYKTRGSGSTNNVVSQLTSQVVELELAAEKRSVPNHQQPYEKVKGRSH